MSNIPLFAAVNLPEMESAAIAVMRSGRIASGEYVAKFEAAISALIGEPNVVSTVDMTSAMFLALHLAGVAPGDEVLTTAFACMSTNAAIAQRGAIPVWVDIKRGTVEMDENDLKRKITSKTKAAILYHVAGYPGPAGKAAAICKEYEIALIEDCDNALLAQRDAQLVGSNADFAVYSFYPNRQINTSEGGALVCKDPELAARARRLRRFGIDASTFRNELGEISPASDIPEIGWSFSMNNLCSALGLAQIPTVRERMKLTRQNAGALTALLRGIPGVRPITVSANALPAYWVYLIDIENRDCTAAKMKEQGIQVSSLHYRNDRYTGFYGIARDELPNTSHLQQHVLALPCGWWLSTEDVGSVVAALDRAVRAK
jgi:dTDP-4-amino-4,6-dideoxygalactose transaminase